MKTRATSWFIRIAIAVVVIGGLIWYLRRGHGTPADKGSHAQSGGVGGRTVPVQVATAARKDYPRWLDGIGTVAAFQQVTVHTLVDGPLMTVNFTEGQTVKKGDLLAQVDPRPYLVQLHTAQGALARDQAMLKAAQADLERQKTLHEQNLVAQATVDASAGTEGSAEGAVKVDQASIESARLNLDYAAIKSPIDGITGVRLVDAGNIIHTTDAGGIVVVTQIDPAAVFFTLPQDNLSDISEALAAGSVEVEVYNHDGTAKIATGTLAVLDNQVNAATATMRMKAIVPNPNRSLWPNAFVKARVLVRTIKDAIVVPAAAIQQGPTGSYVYVVDDSNAVKMTPVIVTLTQGDTSVVGKGLAGGERVVTEGASQLRNGGHVSIGDKNAPGAGSAAGSGDGSATGSGTGSATKHHKAL
ncbi:MAG TPA: efflux RND transporter periplasmic adaptor subunit [Kofleriaceae bacterium]|jgi:multidrug efflux system membrane fusion protein